MSCEEKTLFSFLAGAGLVLFLGAILVNFSAPFRLYDRDKALIEACEKPLHRYEFCVIVAVPVSKD